MKDVSAFYKGLGPPFFFDQNDHEFASKKIIKVI